MFIAEVLKLCYRAKYRFVAKIESVFGKCPVYKGGEKIVLENGEIDLEDSDAVCLQLLSTMMHGYMARQHEDYWRTTGGFDYSKEKSKCPRGSPPYGEGYVLVSYETIPVEE